MKSARGSLLHGFMFGFIIGLPVQIVKGQYKYA